MEGGGEFDRAARVVVNLLRMGRAELEYGFIRTTERFEQAPESFKRGVEDQRKRQKQVAVVCLSGHV